MDIKNILRESLIRELNDNGFHNGIGDDESLIDAEVMDSLGILITLNIFQEKFGIIVSENELREEILVTVNAMTQFIEKKLNKNLQD